MKELVQLVRRMFISLVVSEISVLNICSLTQLVELVRRMFD